ncbi:hypothetical protein D8I24_3141 (plasmid) [Cupriavidus necator H850]|nr:hypothetical protein D8I24_3141 [Cupriavidus necator H850]
MMPAMDKLQMTVTLSADSAPDLLAYLRQVPGARERAFMLKLLAQRGLQLVLTSGPDTLLRPPAATSTPAIAQASSDRPLLDRHDQSSASEPEVIAPSPVVATIARSSERPLAVARPQRAPSPALQPLSASAPAPVSIPAAADPDPLACLDLGALNDAMARFG